MSKWAEHPKRKKYRDDQWRQTVLEHSIESHARGQRRLIPEPAQIPYRDAVNKTYRGIEFDLQLEARWAALFDLIDWPWSYPPFQVTNPWCKCGEHKLTVVVKPQGFADAYMPGHRGVDPPCDLGIVWLGRSPLETAWFECCGDCVGLAELGNYFSEAEIMDWWELAGKRILKR
jgi:hypothetical protein